MKGIKNKRCSKCKIEKPLSEFYKHKRMKDGLSNWCKECGRVNFQKYYKRKKEILLQKNKQWRAKNKAKLKEYDRQRKYNLPNGEYQKLFVAQKGKCFLCNRHQSTLKQALHLDHCHKTGKVRKLLCPRCNIGIGYLENKEFVTRATKYLGTSDCGGGEIK